MADIATSPVRAPRVPWRAAAVGPHRHPPHRGSRRDHRRLPADEASAAVRAGRERAHHVRPEGRHLPVDPATAVSCRDRRRPEEDAGPVFSPNGTRIAFHRSNPLNGSPAEDLVVAAADGSNPVVITASPVAGGVGRYEWAPDSRTLLVNAPDDSAIWSFDTTRTAQPRTVTTGAVFYTRPFQPPNGLSILIYRKTDQGAHIGLFDRLPPTRLRSTRDAVTTRVRRAGPPMDRRSSTTASQLAIRRRSACSS